MRNYLSSLKRSAGFTLIELLVVIGILGILAAALVATIDPFEQLKKAQDTNTTNALVEFINGTTRYYTTHTAFPWDAAPDGAGCTSPTTATALTYAGNGKCYIDALTLDNELKAAYTTSTSLKNIYVTYAAATKVVIGCFNPSSKSILHNTNTHFGQDGTDLSAGICSTVNKDTGTNPRNCYWCTR